MPSETPKPTRIAAAGEVLWDVFPDGPRFGGAPANYACACAGLAGDSATVSMLSAVGQDDLGEDALSVLKAKRVETSLVEQNDRPTGQVLITLDESGSASYEFAKDCAWDNLSWRPELVEAAANLDAVCFGTLGQRSEISRGNILKFVASTGSNCLRIFDVNLRPPFYDNDTILKSLELANVLKLNDEELPLVAGLVGICDEEPDLATLRHLAQTFQLRAVALTRGANGALLVQGSEVSDNAGLSTEVVDTVGAGDAFTAALTLGLLQRERLDDINQRACEIAAYVCSQPGATPEFP